MNKPNINKLNILNEIALRIIKIQEIMIGPLAWNEAKKISGLTIIDNKKGIISLNGDGKEIINNLIAQYENLFGKSSHAICKESVKDLLTKLTKEEIPSSLE